MKILAAMLLSVIMLSSGFMINSPATATPNENANDNAKRSFKLPDNAIEIAPGIFHIGTVLHQGKVVDGFATFDHKPKHNPGGPGGGGGGDTNTCFAFLANGVKWKTVEDWIINPANIDGLDGAAVTDNIASAITEWEDPDDTGGNNFDILGDVVPGQLPDGLGDEEPDDKNEILFGDIDSPGAIAVNISWGVIRGPPSERELVEWNQMYDDVDFDWAIDQDPNDLAPNKMDFLNIATHEVGHAAGMGHPSDDCTEDTMFRFAAVEEIKKQDLFDGDIAGILDLYS